MLVESIERKWSSLNVSGELNVENIECKLRTLYVSGEVEDIKR